MAGESAANPNRAARALGNVLRRLTQDRGHRCRGTLDFSKGRTTQMRPAGLLEGLKQQIRVRSSTAWAPPRNLIGHQAATGLQRLHSSHQPSQQILGSQQGNMDAYCLEVRKPENKFYSLEFHHVVRDNNVATDVLSKVGSTRAQVPVGVFVHELHAPSIPEPAPTTTGPAPSHSDQRS
jgi:hypothetical protein